MKKKHLWYDFLRKLPVTVKRQHNIENYIVDFYIASYKLVIEIDGVQHSTDEAMSCDETRTYVLSEWGITALRYTNKEINQNFNSVVQDILNKLGLSFSDLK